MIQIDQGLSWILISEAVIYNGADGDEPWSSGCTLLRVGGTAELRVRLAMILFEWQSGLEESNGQLLFLYSYDIVTEQ